MPYVSNSELPNSIKQVLPEEAQSTFRAIVNSALTQYKGDDTKAFATAWAGLRRAGWEKNKEGKWIKKVEKEGEGCSCQGSGPTVQAVHVNVPLGEEEKKVYKFDIQKSNNEKRVAFGWAMISRGSHGE